MSGDYTWLKKWIRNWVSPRLIHLGQRALNFVRPAPWEHVPEGWHTSSSTRGWNISGVVDLQRAKWGPYLASIEGPEPLGVNHESRWSPNTGNLQDHNTLISYAYVLASAARQKDKITMLDWGGGIGHYYPLSKAVLPGVELDYYCHDLPRFWEVGREIQPEVSFLENPEECFLRRYDLVLASSSIWYEENWPKLLDKLIHVADPYLYVTRMIFVEHSSSYVAIQRPHASGYQTEYLCWILNRNEFLEYVLARNMQLLREFLICASEHIRRAPEQGYYRGFLFRKDDACDRTTPSATLLQADATLGAVRSAR